MAPEKVFLEVARKLLEFTLAERIKAGSHLAEGASLWAPSPSGVQGQRPGGVQKAKPPENF